MGKYDGVISDSKDYEQVKFNMNDFHWSNDNMININKNIKFILHKSQYSDKFTITNDTLDIDKDKIEINPKSIIQIDQTTGSANGTIIVDQNDKLKVNYNSDFFTDYNSTIWLNIGNGLHRDSNNKIALNIGSCNFKFINGELCFDSSALIDNLNTIKIDNKQRLRLDYSADDFIKDSTGKLYLKIYDKHLKRTQNGVEINIDNDTIKFDTNESKLISSIDKYLVNQYAQNGDIYLDRNKKMKININNYVDDNIGSKVVMNTNNKIDLDIVNQQSGEIYFEKPNELAIRPSPYFTRDSSGHLLPVVNNDHGLNLNNHKLNLDVSSPLTYVNKKLTLDYDTYFKITNNKLDIDLNKLTTDMIIPKQNEGIKLNNDRTLSIDTSVLTSLINVSPLSGIKIVNNCIIIDEGLMSSNVIRLLSNSPLKRKNNNFYDLELDHISIISDFTTGALKVKDTYVPSVVTSNYIKNKVINESYFKELLKFQGPVILKRCSLCYWDLNNESHVDKTIGTNSVIINKFQNEKHVFSDYFYFITQNNPTYHYKHYSFEIFPEVINDNYIYFNNTNQRIKYTDIFNKQPNLTSFIFNFVIQPEKKNVDLNSTLMECENDNYIKLLYNNQGLIFKFGKMVSLVDPFDPNEIIVSTNSMLNKKNVITFYYSFNTILIILNSKIVYNNTNIILFSFEQGKDNLLTHKYHDFYLGNNSDFSQSYNGKFYDFSMLQNIISQEEAINLHEYYKYIHNI